MQINIHVVALTYMRLSVVQKHTIQRQGKSTDSTEHLFLQPKVLAVMKALVFENSWHCSVMGNWLLQESYKVCKHTIASMFIDKLRVEEPNTFPSGEAREAFESKLASDINEVAAEFNSQLVRNNHG